ncbi:MAG: hypothetical protein LUQ40_06050 [Methanomicrobiales archaeon]|nr:hypothetical protein [Methanomicrobiales archaeon]
MLILMLVTLILVPGCIAPPVENAILVEYQRTGGIAGFNDHLTVFSNGTTFVSRRGDVPVVVIMNQSDLDRLVRLFDDAGFTNLAPDYPPASPGADYFDYRVTYRGKTVHAVDTGVPPALEPVLRALNEIVSRYALP